MRGRSYTCLQNLIGAESVIDMTTIEISNAQAQEFATAIFDSIASYIEAHQEEYEEFLRSEEQNGGEM